MSTDTSTQTTVRFNSSKVVHNTKGRMWNGTEFVNVPTCSTSGTGKVAHYGDETVTCKTCAKR